MLKLYNLFTIDTYLSKLQLVEHLEVDLFNEVPWKIDRADSGNGTESSAAYIVDLVVTEMQSSEETHTAEGIRIQFSDLIVTQIQDLQNGITGEGSSKTRMNLDTPCRMALDQ